MTPQPDVVIVGAGSAGCVLAERLSRDPTRSVLLLEAGPSFSSVDEFPPELREISTMAAAIPGQPYNWSLTGRLTPTQTYPLSRGRVLGGSGAINGGVFMRGTREDFDAWAAMGHDRWSFDEVLPFFVGLESDDDFSGPQHGRSGPVPVGRPAGLAVSPIAIAFEDSCREAGFPSHADKNDSGAFGFGRLPLNVRDGVRTNAGMAFVLPHLKRRNLAVRGGALVTRVLIRDRRAIGVEAVDGGELQSIAAGEVVVCAGGLKTPQLLMLSGIGPVETLEKFGITVSHALPGVGANLVDHPSVWVNFRVRSEGRSHNSGNFQSALHFASLTGSGGPDLEIMCGTRSLGKAMSDRGAGGKTGAARLLATASRGLAALKSVALRDVAEQVRRSGDLMLICGLQQPESRGTVSLASADPTHPPDVRYDYLSTAADRDRLRECVRKACELLRSHAFAGLGAERTAPADVDLHSDAALDEWILRSLRTAFHSACTCRMGGPADPDAVVDQYCRVLGLEGLRLIDTSVMPRITSRGPNATAMMMGARASAFFDAAGEHSAVEPCEEPARS